MTCLRCGGAMKPGIYTQQTTNAHGISRYPCGPGRVAECLKCTQCGHSVTDPSTAHRAGTRPAGMETCAGSLPAAKPDTGWAIQRATNERDV